jgi:hypothetical protein
MSSVSTCAAAKDTASKGMVSKGTVSKGIVVSGLPLPAVKAGRSRSDLNARQRMPQP